MINGITHAGSGHKSANSMNTFQEYVHFFVSQTNVQKNTRHIITQHSLKSNLIAIG